MTKEKDCNQCWEVVWDVFLGMIFFQIVSLGLVIGTIVVRW